MASSIQTGTMIYKDSYHFFTHTASTITRQQKYIKWPNDGTYTKVHVWPTKGEKMLILSTQSEK